MSPGKYSHQNNAPDKIFCFTQKVNEGEKILIID